MIRLGNKMMDKITTIFMDVDGTLTDGKVYYSDNGEESKAFHIKDGLLISAMVGLGYRFIVVTGRESTVVIKRMNELGVTEVYQRISNKKAFVKRYIENAHISESVCAYIGDDLNDLGVMKTVGFRACPADSCFEVKEIADYVSNYHGGNGAVREILEFISKENGDWAQVISRYE